MAGVQLIGKESIISSFLDIGAGGWALLEGKRPIVTGEGADELEKWLERFAQAGSTAGYTLRIYESDPGFEGSMSASCLASFTVRLVDLYAGQGIAGYGSKLEQRLQGIEKKLEGAGDDEDEDIADVIMGYLREPDKLDTAIGAVMRIFNSSGTPPGGAIAGPTPINKDDQLQRLAAAIDKLEKADPNLVVHMEKLAALSQSDPAMFRSVIAKLDLF